VNSLPLATIYEVNIPLRKWKKSLLQRNSAQMTWHIKREILKLTHIIFYETYFSRTRVLVLLCCCSSCCWEVINQNTAIFANFVQFHHAFVIAQNIALLSNFTMHSAALPGRLRQVCLATLPGRIARQDCPAALTGSLDRKDCPAGLPGSLDRQFDQFRPDLMRALRSHRTVLQWQVTKLHARAAVLTGLNLFLVQFHHAFIICMRARAAVQQTGSNLFSCSYVDLFRSLLQVFYANAGKD
jgi:hypothetical protein